MNYRTVHITRYRYDKPVASSYNEAHLLPRSCTGQTLVGASLSIDPPCRDYRDRQDFSATQPVISPSWTRTGKSPSRPPARYACRHRGGN